VATALPLVTIYTDGACDPNPGPGGWAAVLLRDGAEPKELCGAAEGTTNNQMELRAALEALQALPEPHRVLLVSDSQYLCRGFSDWFPQWRQTGYVPDDRGGLPNWELWRGLQAEAARHEVEARWVRGHGGDRWNARVDVLARSMLPAPPLPLADPDAAHLFTGAWGQKEAGVGGWAVLLNYRQASKPLAGRVPEGQLTRLHLRAAVQGLRALTRVLPVHLYTTSGFVRDAATRWLSGWPQRDWQTVDGRPVQNRDLWEELLAAAAPYRVRYHLVPPNALPGPMRAALDLARDAARTSPSPLAGEGRGGG
jgi:ribonuclease HI